MKGCALNPSWRFQSKPSLPCREASIFPLQIYTSHNAYDAPGYRGAEKYSRILQLGKKKHRRALSLRLQRFLLFERCFLSFLEQETAWCETKRRLGSLQEKWNCPAKLYPSVNQFGLTKWEHEKITKVIKRDVRFWSILWRRQDFLK